MIVKRIHSQDAHYKFSPKKSGETSLNLSNDIFQLIAPELTKGEEKPVSFTLFRSDYLKALSVIINHSPLYVTSSTTATEVTSDPSVFIKDFQSICTFFGPNEINTYTVNLLYRSDGRIYLNTLEDKNSKFNLRHFLVEETSSLEFEKIGDDITVRLRFDSITQNKKESTPQLIVSNKKLTSFVLSSIRHFNKIDKLDSIVPFTSPTSPIKVSKNNLFSLTGMFLESTIGDVKERNTDHIRWFEDVFKLGERNVFLSTQWNSQGDYQLTLDDLIKMIQTCYGEKYFYKTGPNGEHQLYYNDTNHQQTAMGIEKILPYLTALRTKPFMLLAGISGTGKSRIVRELAFKTCPEYLQDKDGTTPGNYCMIEVKPNWHDSTELIGYYSNLSQSYQFKKFVKFLVKAQMNPEVPFFVCLDEMNLAPVEQYFAEILSILETRKHPKKVGVADMEIINTEVIVENRYFTPSWKDKDNAVHEKIMSDADWYKEFFDIEKGSAEEIQVQKYQDAYTLRTEGLKLPDNVFIIGTVNMDDTTHPFSRKVIDRAMTIEMNGGRLSDMFGGSRDLEYIEDEEVQKRWQQAFHQYYVTADEVLDEHSEYAEALKEKLPARLDAINKALKGTPFEVSYRVLNELTIMVGVMLDDKEEGEEIDIDGIINQAVDNILLMKILPRIEGDADMFSISNEYKKENDITYDNRLEWLMDIAPDIKSVKTSEEDKSDSTNEDQPTARKKIKEMIDRLNSQEFTRFWP